MNNVQILEKTGDFFSSQSVFPPLTVQISLSVSAFGLRGDWEHFLLDKRQFLSIRR